MLLANLRHFEKYRQYIGADCTRSGALFLEGCDLYWERCHIQKGVLEPREGGGQSSKLCVGQES